MINYYKLLGIKRDIDEQELFNKLHDSIDNLKENAKQLNGKEKKYALVAASLCKRFLSVIESYGSKEAYDKALDMSYGRIVKVKKYFNSDNRRKWIVVSSLIGVAVITTIVGNNVKKVNIPVYEGDSISKICQECDVKWYNMPSAMAKYSTYVLKPGDIISVYVTKDKAEEVRDYAGKKVKEEELKNTPITYQFHYVVQPDDSDSLLKERFLAVKIERPNAIYKDLNQGEVVIIYTTDSNIANDMEEEYNSYLKSLEPVDYEYYKIKPGDTLPEIAAEYGVTCNQIMKYNPQIEYIGDIKAGDTLKIPVYQQTKSNVK